MRQEVTDGPLVATIRECWVLASNRRLSSESPRWRKRERRIHAIAVETVEVEESRRRQGHLRRFLDRLCADDRFDMVVVEQVQNPILAEALQRWGWDFDLKVMDFYRERAKP
jgi:hypothetical protein